MALSISLGRQRKHPSSSAEVLTGKAEPESKMEAMIIIVEVGEGERIGLLVGVMAVKAASVC